MVSTPIKESPKFPWDKTDPLPTRFRYQEPASKVSEIQALVEKLSKVDNVARVRAIAPRTDDLHWIEFEMEVRSGLDLSDETWDIVQDLVIDSEWKFRDETHENWYFHAEVVSTFSRLQPGGRVVSQSYLQVVEAHPEISEHYMQFKLYSVGIV
ncbi:MAG: hypothetical protein VKJ24_08600 [Synechococcales bacterium]|nr:hypothetical protein [Synechococcales bacterium]